MDLITVIIGYVLVGIGVSSVSAIVYLILGQSSDLAHAAALSAVSDIEFTGSLIGPPIIGLIAEHGVLSLSIWVIVHLGVMIFAHAAKGLDE